MVLMSACGSGAETSTVQTFTAEPTIDGRPSTSTSSSDPTKATSLDQPYIGPLTFDWASDCTIPVLEAVTKDGSTAHLSYGIEVVAEGANLVVSLVDMVIADVDGQPVSADESATALAPFRLPSFVVDDRATVVEVRGVDELIDDIEAADGPDIAEMTSEFRALVSETVATKYWDTWAGFWAAWESVDEPRFETIVPTPIGDSEFETRIVVESLGTTDDGHAILRQTQTVEGAEMLRAMGLVSDLMEGEELQETLRSVSGHRIITIDLTTDPATLRPASAQIVIDVEVTTDEGTQSQLEIRTWTFDWPSSRCAV